MPDDASPRAHAAAGDDQHGARQVAELSRVLSARDREERVPVEHVVAVSHLVEALFVEDAREAFVRVGDREPHGGVQSDGKMRDFSALHELVQEVEQGLRAADGEARDEHAALVRHGAQEHPFEVREYVVVAVCVVAAAVGALHHHEVERARRVPGGVGVA